MYIHIHIDTVDTYTICLFDTAMERSTMLLIGKPSISMGFDEWTPQERRPWIPETVGHRSSANGFQVDPMNFWVCSCENGEIHGFFQRLWFMNWFKNHKSSIFHTFHTFQQRFPQHLAHHPRKTVGVWRIPKCQRLRWAFSLAPAVSTTTSYVMAMW